MDGRLTKEVDTFFAGNYRHPDICYLTNEQIRATKLDIAPSPQGIIEIISAHDKSKKIEHKMKDYRNVEVPVYRSKQIQVCEKGDFCSAAPVLPDFNGYFQMIRAQLILPS